MNSGLISFRKWLFFALLTLLLTGMPFAMSAPHQAPEIHSSRNPLADLLNLKALQSARGMPGEAPAFADFDGDQRQDIAVARLGRDRYEIVVLFSLRSEVAVLNPRLPLAGFTLQARDINNDGFPDVIITDALASQPLAVWLGEGQGKLEVFEQNPHESNFGPLASSRSQSDRISPDQDLLDEFPDPACEKTADFFGDPGFERKGFILYHPDSCTLRKAYVSIAPRSPPESNPTQTI
jgi:hypothetical protein